MTRLEVSFEEDPWQRFLDSKPDGAVLAAGNLLALLEGADAETVEDAFDEVARRGLMLDVSALPRPTVGGETGLRLQREEKLAREGLRPEDLDDNLRIYMQELDAVSTGQSEDALAAGAARGDEAARDALTHAGLKRVVTLACEYTGFGVLLADLIQEGSIGLWQAVQSYREGDYALFRDAAVRCALARTVTLHARSSGIGEKLKKAMEDYRAADAALLAELGRNPTNAEIAARLRMSPEQCEAVGKTVADASLLARSTAPQPPEEERERVQDTAAFQTRARVAELLEDLSSEDRELVSLRFGLNGKPPLTPQEAAQKLGLTLQELTEREASAMQQLRLSKSP